MAGETVIGDRYRLDGVPLGAGGMGTVWGARDLTLRRRVAVKLIRSPDEELTRRFLRECRITAELHHPGVPAVYDIGTTYDGSPFLVMEYIDGRTVDDLIAEEEGLPIGWAAAIAAQICAVLAMAHRRRRVHRDLKPSNLMICPDGSVKVFDFGLAGALEAGDLSRITLTGQRLGTHLYMAPEQIRAEPVSPQTDLYALGCVLYAMLSGNPPFTGSPYEVMRAHTGRRPRRVRSQHGHVIPSNLSHLIAELLSKNADERPSGAEEVYTRLMPFLGELRPLPDAVHPDQGRPMRMYASVIAQMGTGDPVETFASAVEVRHHDSEVLSKRLDLAEFLFDAADYTAAAEAFIRLADAAGPDHELGLVGRLRAATCHAADGEPAKAADGLLRVIPDLERVYGPDDDRPLDTRLEAGRLLYDAGDPRAASVLADLRADLLRRRGSEHPALSIVDELLPDRRAR